MKSKLLFSCALLSMSVMNAGIQKKSLSVAMDCSGKPSWFYQAVSGELTDISKEDVLKKNLRSPKQVRSYEKYVKSNPGSFCNQGVYSHYKQTLEATKKSTQQSMNLFTRFLNASREETDFYTRMAKGLQDKALSASGLNQIAAEASHAASWTNYAAEVAGSLPKVTSAAAVAAIAAPAATVSTAAATATAAIVTPSKVAQFATQHPNKVLPMYLAGALVGGTALYAGINQAFAYMQPKVEVKSPTYLECAKAQVQAGYNFAKINAVKGYESSVTFVKANPKSTAGAVAVVAALGYVAYKNSDAIFGNSKKAITAPVVKATPVRMHSKPFSRG